MGFGSSKQKSENSSQQTSQSYNQAYPFLQGALGDQVGNAGKGSGALGDQVGNAGKGSRAIASLLGLNGSDEGTNAFNQFKDSSGYNFVQNEGVKGITGSLAAKGLLGSGSALKAISNYSSNLASNFLNSYLSNLMGLTNTGIQAGQILSNTGIQAGQILASAGSTANSQGTSYGNSSGSSFNASLG